MTHVTIHITWHTDFRSNILRKPPALYVTPQTFYGPKLVFQNTLIIIWTKRSLIPMLINSRGDTSFMSKYKRTIQKQHPPFLVKSQDTSSTPVCTTIYFDHSNEYLSPYICVYISSIFDIWNGRMTT